MNNEIQAELDQASLRLINQQHAVKDTELLIEKVKKLNNPANARIINALQKKLHRQNENMKATEETIVLFQQMLKAEDSKKRS